jgi:multidrug efflux pump
MLARFFIDRPIFAAVLSFLIVIAGALALPQLPISEYPSVVPPTVVVRGVYPGANPKVIAETVASPLEQQINGVEGMLYMFSQSTADGLLTVTVTFALGTDLDTAQVQVQNRVAQALPRLPAEVQRIGVTTEKASPDLMMVVHIVSPDSRYDMLYLSNFAHLQVKDELARIDGIGSVQVFGAGEYSMRVWLDPDRLASRELTATDVVASIREQNLQVAAGTLGAPPAPTDTTFQLSINARGRLSTEEEFGDIVVRATPDGQITRIRDVGRVELGSNRYALRSLLDNQPAVAIGISQRPGSNAIEASSQVREVMDRLASGFPEGVSYRIAYDPTIYVRQSIRAVVVTLFEAILLVVIVVMVFLQTWRASIIPLVAVPVSLVGTFAVMLMFGFSLNTLSLFGLVLSIGIVVDDAIVVVENVERHIEMGATPIEATRLAMDEVSGPIIAIALVLCAVFVPTAFISGLTGQFYRQFALTIAISTVISAINSLTLSPALASRLLKPRGAERDRLQRIADLLFGWFFRGFNRFFTRMSSSYASGVSRVLRVSAAAVFIYVGLLGLTALGFAKVPQGFVPAQDKDYLVAFAQLPDAATLDRTEGVIREMSRLALEHPGVESSIAFPGLSVNGFVNASNAGIAFVMLKPAEERAHNGQTAESIVQALNGQFAGIQDAFVAIFPPPPVQGLGSVGGFKLYVQDRAGLGFEDLYAQTQGAMQQGSQHPSLTALFSSFQVSVPQVDADVDRERAKTYGVPITDVFDTLQVYLGSLYVNDFNRFGRTYQVNVQAESSFRLQPEQIGRLKTRNAAGQMVPLGSLVKVGGAYGPDQVMHYNGFPAAEINGAPGPGFSSGQAQAAIAQVLDERLPRGMSFEWTELAYQEALSGNTMLLVFPLCVLLVYVVLAALYESWTLPLTVILIVPMTLLSAIAGVWLTGGDNNIFTQISFLVLAGLACKNAILIVEFAKMREEAGDDRVSAILEACRVRLRPVLMTSVAFIMGVVPLVLSSGAGAEIRQAMGIAVFAGMLGVTVFGLFLTPVFFVVVGRIVQRLTRSGVAADRRLPAAVGLLMIIMPLTGCSLRGPYKAPEVKPAALSAGDAALFAPQPFDPAWWRHFDDPVLDTLEKAALAANHDVRTAVARVDQARAVFDEARRDRFPQVGAGASVDRRQQAVPGISDEPVTTTTYQAGIDAFWEIDLFGRVRSAVRSASATAQSLEASLDDVRVSVAAEMARSYFELRGLQQQLAVAERSLLNQRETLRLTQVRRDAGIGEEQDVASAAARTAGIEASIPPLRAALAARSHRIAVLAGVRPGELTVDLGPRAYPALAKAVPIGEPTELLRRRPDVRAAERRLAAAAAREGVAAADLFPRISISGFLGLLAGRGNLFGRADSRAWAVTPALNWAGFDLGSAKARLRGTEAATRESLVAFEQVTLRAIEEAENALATYREEQERLVKLTDQARESARAASIARVRFREGAVDFLALLDAERTELQAHDAVAQAESGVFTSVVGIYKALGGIPGRTSSPSSSPTPITPPIPD